MIQTPPKSKDQSYKYLPLKPLHIRVLENGLNSAKVYIFCRYHGYHKYKTNKLILILCSWVHHMRYFASYQKIKRGLYFFFHFLRRCFDATTAHVSLVIGRIFFDTCSLSWRSTQLVIRLVTVLYDVEAHEQSGTVVKRVFFEVK